MNSPFTEKYDNNYYFYINRGYPTPWSGVSAINKELEFPIIKAPFLVTYYSNYVKIINLKVFIPLFIKTMLISYIFSFFFIKAIEGKKYIKFILIPIYFILFVVSIFTYFIWFPRV